MSRWVSADDVRVGMTLLKYRKADGYEGPIYQPFVVADIYRRSDRSWPKSTTGDGIGYLETYEWLVEDGQPPRSAGDPNRWNAKCTVCGRGIYHGFTAVEHEGGPCR